MTSLRLGISPLSWTNESILDLGENIPFGQCVTEAAASGYVGLELGRKFPEEPSKILAALSRHDLSPVSAWYSGFLSERDVDAEWPTVAAASDLLVALGCKVMVYGECGCGPDLGEEAPMAQRPRTDRIDIQAYAARVTALAERLAARGITLVYHHHMMQPIETASQIDALMEATGPAVKLLLDTGHLALAGDDYVPVMHRWWDRVAHIHLKDVRQNVLSEMDRSTTTFIDGVRRGMFTVPGNGDLDFAPVAKQIAQKGYDGWVLVEAEQDPTIALPGPMARCAFDHLSSIFGAVGLTLQRNSNYVR